MPRQGWHKGETQETESFDLEKEGTHFSDTEGKFEEDPIQMGIWGDGVECSAK